MTDAPATNELLALADRLELWTPSSGNVLTLIARERRMAAAALRAAATPSAQGAHAALAQLDSADARSTVARALCCPDGCQYPDRCCAQSVQRLAQSGKQIDAILSAALLPDASPGNGAEKVPAAWQYLPIRCRDWANAATSHIRWKNIDGVYQERPLFAALHSTGAAGETTSSDGVPGKRSASGAAAAPIETEDAEVAFSPSELLFYGLTDAVGETTTTVRPGDPRLNQIVGGPSSFSDYGEHTPMTVKSSTSEAIPADVLAMKEACKRAALSCEIRFYPYASSGILAHQMDYARNDIAAAIDNLSPEVRVSDDQ